TYGSGQTLDFTAHYDENVTVTGTPRIPLTIGASAKFATYLSGTGTANLVFRYTVVSGDSDSDGIASASPIDLNGGTLKDAAGNTSADLNYATTTSLALNGGTIKDAFGNSVTLTLPATNAANSLAGNKAIVIDTTTPTVTNVTSTATDGAYTTGAVIPVTVTF